MHIQRQPFPRATWLPLLVLAVLLTHCRSRQTGEQTEIADSLRTNLSTTQTAIRYAKGFSVEYFPGYKRVRIFNSASADKDTATYVLIARGTLKPANLPAGQVIETPIRSLVTLSSMHIGLLSFLNAEDVLLGVDNATYISSPIVAKRVAEGKIKEVGSDQTINEEALIAMHPDLLMVSGSPTAQLSRYQTLTQAGIPVLINSEWLETTPLGRAEWVKLVAVLLDKEALVNQKFAEVETEYKRLTALAKNVAKKPSLIAGMSYKDAWFVPYGDSYMAQFFRDAGSTYHWNDTKGQGGLGLSFEAVYPVALTADYWVNVGTANTKGDILAQDVRYGDFKPFKTGQVFNYNKRVNAKGANDYWESGAVNAHLVLADLIKILHPELLPAHKLVYYQQIK
jgi:iron complex transport system substrate-binding protein